MTEPITDEAQLRGVHSTNTSSGNGDPYCRACGTSWPCLVIRVLNVSEARIDLERNRADEAVRKLADLTVLGASEEAWDAKHDAEAEVARLRAVLSQISDMAWDDGIEGHFLARLIDIDKMASEALAPREGCQCRSHYERTGTHVEACPRAALAAPPDQPTHRRGSEG